MAKIYYKNIKLERVGKWFQLIKLLLNIIKSNFKIFGNKRQEVWTMIKSLWIE